MTITLCHDDSYLREFDAIVVGVADKGVALDRTAFYPGGGGQPPDSGVLRSGGGSEWRVRKLSRSGGVLVHESEGGDFPPEGEAVRGEIDWERRYQLMRTHTALHILCGVVWRDYGAHVTGGDMKPLTARMDFELESMSADFAREVEGRINEEVEAARQVVIRTLPRDGGVRDTRPDTHQDQPAARFDHGGPDRGHIGPGPPGRRRHPRRQHQRGGQDQGRGPREQGPHQQAAEDSGRLAVAAF